MALAKAPQPGLLGSRKDFFGQLTTRGGAGLLFQPACASFKSELFGFKSDENAFVDQNKMKTKKQPLFCLHDGQEEDEANENRETAV